MMRLGYINYLNCYPFYHLHFTSEPFRNTEVFPHYPSELNSGIISGNLDMSPVSAAALSDCYNDVYVLPDFCLSSVGYVGSVILRSNFPIENLSGKKVGLTSASRTSIALLKIILGEFYKINPDYVPCEPNPDMKDLDAALVIGNEAIEKAKSPVHFTYDLGELWLQKTGYPVVFAIFVLQKKYFEKDPSTVKGIIEGFMESLACLEHSRTELIEAASKRYPRIEFDIDYYYDLLQFQFSKRLKEGLDYFYELGIRHGLIDPDIKIDYLKMD